MFSICNYLMAQAEKNPYSNFLYLNITDLLIATQTNSYLAKEFEKKIYRSS